MTNNIFDLFNLVDTAEEQRKTEEAEKKAAQEAEQQKQREELQARIAQAKPASSTSADKTDAPSSTTAKTETFNINESSIVRYYGEEHEITAYFTAEELEEGLLRTKKDKSPVRVKITAEDVRKRLEKDFPELVKDFTEIVFLEQKNILVPTMKAKKKGSYVLNEMVPSKTDITSLRFGKIPFSILSQFISLAQMLAANELEVHADIYFDMANQEFVLDVPKQLVHKYWVSPIENEIETLERVGIDTVKVCEIHSHHLLKAIPSNQDNESERIPGMKYVIIGNLENEWPDIFIRTFVNENIGWRELGFKDIFLSPFTDLPIINFSNITIAEV